MLIARLHRRAAARRGRALLYSAICSALGLVIGLVLVFVVVIAPVTTAAGAVVRIKEELTRAACNIPVASDWLGSSCDVDEDVQAFLDASEASGFSAMLRAAYDCSNVPPEQRKRRLCDQRSLDQVENSAIPTERSTLIPIFVDAGFKQKVPWALLAAVAGARSNFGEQNCSPDGGRSGGFYHFTAKEWRKYATDGGRMTGDREGACWEVPTAADALADGKSPYELFDPKPDGKADPRDPADAIATMGRLLAAEGARGKLDWDDYNGADAAACPVNPSIDGKITPAPALAVPAASGTPVALPSEPAADPEKVGVSHYAAGGTTASGLPASASLMGFAELSKDPSARDFSALGDLPMGSVVAITKGTTTVYAAKVDVGAGGARVNGQLRAIDLLPRVADKLGLEGLGLVTVSAPIGKVKITRGMTVAAANAAIRKVVTDAGGGTVPGAPGTSAGDVVSQIKSVINRRVRNSPLIPHVEYAVQYSLSKGLDPRFIFAIAGSESSFATTGNAASLHNAWGMGPGKSYPDWEAGFRAAIDNLNGDLYRGSGLFTITQIGGRWCPVGASNDPTGLNNNWIPNVTIIYTELGGDPTKSVFTGESATDPGLAPVPSASGTGTSGTDGPPYSGAAPTDKVSRAVAARVGESVPHTPCYVAQVHQWYQAITSFGEGAPPSGSVPQNSALRARIVQIMQGELGIAEPAAYSKYADGRVEPWCADFQSWVWTQAGVDYDLTGIGYSRAYSGTAAHWAYKNSVIKPPTATPEPGDAAIYERGRSNVGIDTAEEAIQAVRTAPGGMTDHVNIVERVYPDGSFDAIGGNQSFGAVTRNQRLTTTSGYGASIIAFASPIKPGQAETAPAAGAGAGGSKVVWIQGGHVAPLEPGYRGQTGAPGEAAFTRKLSDAVIDELKQAGIDARFLPGKVDPVGVQGAVFLSLHYDTTAGWSSIGHAVSDPDWGENYYHGEGTGTARSTPYADSAPHRAGATEVTPAVETQSKRLANLLAAGWRRIYTRANGARSSFRGVEPSAGNARMMHYYGYFRVNAGARVLIETGAGGTDGAFLSRTPLLAATIAEAVEEYLGR